MSEVESRARARGVRLLYLDTSEGREERASSTKTSVAHTPVGSRVMRWTRTAPLRRMRSISRNCEAAALGYARSVLTSNVLASRMPLVCPLRAGSTRRTLIVPQSAITVIGTK